MLSVASVGLQCWMQKVKNENKIDYYSDSLVSIALHSLHFIFIFNCDKYNIPWIVVIDVFFKSQTGYIFVSHLARSNLRH